MQASKQQVTEYLSWLTNVRRVLPSTVYLYGDTIEKFGEFVNGTPWHMVTAENAESFMARPRRGGVAPAPSSMQRDRVVLSGFFNYLASKGAVSPNPMVDVGIPKVRRRQPKALTDTELLALWDAARIPEDKVWLGLGGFVGLRRTEMSGLEVDKVDTDSGWIKAIVRKGRSVMDIEYRDLAGLIGDSCPALGEAAAEWVGVVEPYVRRRRELGARFVLPWDTPASAKVVQRIGLADAEHPDPIILNKRLKGICDRTAVKATVHSLRHTCATNLFRSGLDVMTIADQLGHTSIDTTRIYLNTSGQVANWRASRARQD
jgi:integrase/recombinase XerD